MAGSVEKQCDDERGPSTGQHDLSYLATLTNVPEDQLIREVRDNKPKLSGKVLTYALAFVAGTGFTLFGYVFNRKSVCRAFSMIHLCFQL